MTKLATLEKKWHNDKYLEIHIGDYITDSPSKRASYDRTCDTFGKNLFGFHKSSQYHIINGR